MRSAGTKLRIKEFLLNSQNQVVCKVVREVLNLFKMELPVPVEKLPYRKSPEKQAELISKYVTKGSQICIRGYLTNREWSDKQGNKRISTEIIAEEISFAGGKESSAEAKNEAYTPRAYSTQNSQNFEEIPGDESLPF